MRGSAAGSSNQLTMHITVQVENSRKQTQLLRSENLSGSTKMEMARYSWAYISLRIGMRFLLRSLMNVCRTWNRKTGPAPNPFMGKENLHQDGSPWKKRLRCWNDLVSEESCMSLVESNTTVVEDSCSPCSYDDEPLSGRHVNSDKSESAAEGTDVGPGWRHKNFLDGQRALGSPLHGVSLLHSGYPARSTRAVKESITLPSGHDQSCGRAVGNGQLPWHEELSAAKLAARALERVVVLQAERSWLREQLQVGSMLLRQLPSTGLQSIRKELLRISRKCIIFDILPSF